MKKLLLLLALLAFTACSNDSQKPTNETKPSQSESKTEGEKENKEDPEEKKANEDAKANEESEELPSILFESVYEDLKGQIFKVETNVKKEYDFDGLDSYKEKAKNVVLAKLIDKEDISKEDGDDYPKTKLKFEIVDSLYGDLKAGETSVFMPGAIISYEDVKNMNYKDGLPKGIADKSEEDLSKYNYQVGPKFYIQPKKEQAYILFLDENNTVIGDGLGSFEIVGNGQDAYKFLKDYKKDKEMIDKEKTSFSHDMGKGIEKFTFAEILDALK